MARARNIKPGFFSNDQLAECQPFTRLLFAGLWTLADREGRMEDRPKKIKVAILPYDDVNVDELLNELAEKRDQDGTPAFILRYQVNGIAYIQIMNFKKHNNPHVREPKSMIPAPGQHGASTVQDPEDIVQAPEETDATTIHERERDAEESSKINSSGLHGASTVLAPDLHRTGPAESPLLNPLSPLLNPESPIPESGAGPVVDNLGAEKFKPADQAWDEVVSVVGNTTKPPEYSNKLIGWAVHKCGGSFTISQSKPGFYRQAFMDEYKRLLGLCGKAEAG